MALGERVQVEITDRAARKPPELEMNQPPGVWHASRLPDYGDKVMVWDQPARSEPPREIR